MTLAEGNAESEIFRHPVERDGGEQREAGEPPVAAFGVASPIAAVPLSSLGVVPVGVVAATRRSSHESIPMKTAAPNKNAIPARTTSERATAP